MTTTGDVLNLKAAIEDIVGDWMKRFYPAPRYGIVATSGVSIGDTYCLVTMNGDTDPVQVNLNTIKPTGAGDVVRVDGMPGDRRVGDVISQGRSQGIFSNVRVQSGGLSVTNGASQTLYVYSPTLNTVILNSANMTLEAAPGGSFTFRTTTTNVRRFVMTDSANYTMGNLIFRDQADTLTDSTYAIGRPLSTRFDLAIGTTGIFVVAIGGVNGNPGFVVRGNGGGSNDILYDFYQLSSGGGSANLYVTGTSNRLFKSTSLAKYKKKQERVEAAYEIFSIPAKTWVDSRELEENPATTRRYVGAVVEDILELAKNYPFLDILIVRDENGEPISIAYDRAFFAALPAFKDWLRRTYELETEVKKMKAGLLTVGVRI